MSILAIERATYQSIWTSVEAYGEHAPGERCLPLFLQCIERPDCQHLTLDECQKSERHGNTVLDAGTGSGKGALALQGAGFDVYTCDVTPDGLTPEARMLPYHDACLWHDLSPLARNVGHPGRTKFDFVYCTDVLEHLPTQFTMLAIDQMLRVAKEGLFLSVALVPDSFGAWVGKPLHQTVQSYLWWRDSLKELGTVTDARDLLNSAVFFVRPR